jgi:MurNAc alpha-1-phosphate uridylyltransferase
MRARQSARVGGAARRAMRARQSAMRARQSARGGGAARRAMIAPPAQAMVLAAGLGLRLRPLTTARPKPLIVVADRALIDRALDRLIDAGVKRAVVNLYYKPGMLRDHLAGRQGIEIVFSDETDQLLETGGGVAKAMPELGPGPFYVVNSDIIWRDAQINSLHELARIWDDGAMDAMLLLHPTVGAIGYSGPGDFLMAADGRLKRRDARVVAPFVFTGVQILHPRLFANSPRGPFSLNVLYDRAANAGRLFGLRHQGDWMDVGTPNGLAAAERALRE